jgi:hypothetical protein
MARGSEDEEVRDSQPKLDNPFIKFRQFADEQISSLLQGIIGLPSAFSKTSGNARWADFDDDLRRRDEVQARQKELRESEARKAHQGTHNEQETDGAEIPVKKYSGWNKVSAVKSESPGNDPEIHGKHIKDLPLYSPVSRSLFAHLEAGGKAQNNWGPVRNPAFPYPFEESTSTDKMTAIQSIFFSELKVEPDFRCDYSLLPYLLFSSYSPLRLQQYGMIPPTDMKSSRIVDTFPYCDAFEDLMLVSQGRPMTTAWMPPLTAGIPPICTGSWFGYHWIRAMHSQHMLQQKQRTEHIMLKHVSVLDKIPFFRPGNTETDTKNETHKVFEREVVGKLNSGVELNAESPSPKTEEEMYERFLRLMSPMSPNTINPDLAMVEELFKAFGQEFKDMKPAEILKSIIDELLPQTPEAEQQLRSLADGFIRDFMPSLHQELKGLMEREQLEGKPKPFTPPTDSEKVVSSTTTSEHTTNDDGSVETSVTVWKRFADGRETVTTTTHLEDPARDEDGNPAQRNLDTPAPQGDDKETKKEPTKKGWFWN